MQCIAEGGNIFECAEAGLPVGAEPGRGIIQQFDAENIPLGHQKRLGNHIIEGRISSLTDELFCLCQIGGRGHCLYNPAKKYGDGFFHVVA